MRTQREQATNFELHPEMQHLDYQKFSKVQEYLKKHQDHVTAYKEHRKAEEASNNWKMRARSLGAGPRDHVKDAQV